MSLDTAIKNVGDYYAAHYLADKKGFSKDIAEKVKGWKEQGSQSVPRKLAALGETYFKAKTEALNYDDPLLRVRADNDAINRWHPALLDALGYRSEPFDLVLESAQKQIPVLHRLNRHNQPWLVIAEAPFCLTGGESDEEPLEQAVIAQTQHVDGLPTLSESWEKAVALLFKQEDAPRWVMLLAGGRIYLFDAHTFAQGRYLWIDLDEAFGRRQAATFDAIAALLSDEALVPQGESDEVLHERLREGSLKSTHGVSEKLQGAVRDAIEAIANGWVEARRQNNLGYRQLSEREELLPDGSREITAEQLRHDALIYVYRLLFCFYAEARGGELGILPINDDVYRLGYSLESLRDLVDANEPGTTTENGTYIAEHLERLFQLIYDGFDPERESTADEETKSPFGQGPRQESLFGAPAGEQLSLKGTGIGRSKYTPGKVFAIQPLTATLFDPQATPLLSRVKLPNRILHKVVRCLSLGTSQQSKRVGRINYAELGIVQLGSVYEGLLSYKGFFAAEDLIQVHQKAKNGKPMLDNAVDSKVPTWFVPAHRENEFKAGEIVLEHRTERTRIYRTGEFILHLNGVDRVNSASYYTPEVLTRTLVEEALKERLKDFGPEQADDILDLKICEPAMGSAAFLVEAIDQLAHHYLELKQKQLGENIDPSNYEDELRRVRHYIAVHNVYGVDLNPVAVELGALSLWLSTIHRLKVSEGDEDNQPLFQPAATPWFGLRLRAGNSLIGARRSVWKKDQLLRGKHYGKYAEIPRQLKPGEDRQPGEIYHFLVWDEDMAPAASDKLMKEHWPDECDAINTWRKKQVKTKCSVEEVVRLERLSERIDELWKDYSISRQRALADSACTSSVWPKAQNSLEALRNGPTLRRQEGLKASLEAESGAFQRLKLLMDSWCSFYFWPLDQSDNLPSRAAWLAAAEVLLGIGTDDLATRAMLDIQLGEDIELEALFQASEQKLPDAENLSELVPWYGVGRRTTAEQNFHHWELIFTEVLGPKVQDEAVPNGFDLMFGNPPWLVLSWDATLFTAEIDPLVQINGLDPDDVDRVLKEFLKDDKYLYSYLRGVVSVRGSISFLSDPQMYPKLSGSAGNLYKNFMEIGWRLISSSGKLALIHLKGIFDDEKGSIFRAEMYKRLNFIWSFRNERRLFKDVHHGKEFECSLCGSDNNSVDFYAIFSLFDVKAIADCHDDTLAGSAVPRMKQDSGAWQTKGHPDRKVFIDEKVLKIFSEITGHKGDFSGTKLVQVYDSSGIVVMSRISSYGSRLNSFEGQFRHETFFTEKSSKIAGILKRQDNPSFQPNSFLRLILAGPHIGIANPFFKQARTNCATNNSYDHVHLDRISDSFIPRSANAPGDKNGNFDAFNESIKHWPNLGECFDLAVEADESEVSVMDEYADHSEEKYYTKLEKYCGDSEVPRLVTARYRYANRRMTDLMMERSLYSAIYPPGVTHTDGVFSIIFKSTSELTRLSAFSASLIADFFVRVSGKTNLGLSVIGKFPIIKNTEIADMIVNRYLRLCCITSAYKELWEAEYSDMDDGSALEKSIINLNEVSWRECCSVYDPKFPVRSDLARRNLLVEIDVLFALELGISIADLTGVYQTYFSVLSRYENVDLYDAKGFRLPNGTRKDPGAKELSQQLASHDGSSPLTVRWEIDNGNQTVTKTFYPPFSHVDRIEDYRTAYRVFSERLGLTENNKEPA